MIAIYVRQSVDKKDSISIESQIEFCKREFSKEDEEYKVYSDKGYSGKNTNRPAFEEMINDIQNGLIKRVIVYKLDRISRSTLDFANIIDTFQKHKVEFTSTTEKFDTSTPIGKAMLNIVIVFAELERLTIQMRIKDNYYARGKKGFFMGGRIPYGFNKVQTKVNGIKTSTFENDPEQTNTIQNMYKLYSTTDMSLGQISDYLNNEKISAPLGGLWDSGKISRLLRSPIYVKADADIYQYYKNKGCIISNDITDFIGIYGCFLYGKRDLNERKYTNVENHVLSIGLHEGIVDSKTWLLCQYKLDDNKQIKNSGKGRHTWLSGIVKCGYCGYAVSVIKSSTGRYKYFNCRGKTNMKICKGHSVPILVNEIENIIKGNLLQKVSDLKNTNLIEESVDDISVNKIKLQIMDIDNQIDNLLNQLSQANNITMKYINERISSLDSTKNQLLEEMKKITITNTKKESSEEIIKHITNWDSLPMDDKKMVCRYYIKKIKIKDDSLDIEWIR